MSKYHDLEVSVAKHLMALKDENAKLMRLLADTLFDNAVLKDFAARNRWCETGSG